MIVNVLQTLEKYLIDVQSSKVRQLHHSTDWLVRQQLCSAMIHDQGLQLQGLEVDPAAAGK